MSDQRLKNSMDFIAITGMSGVFPGANTVEDLWRNLRSGLESISFFSPEDLEPHPFEGLNPAATLVPARGILEGIENFDAQLFGIHPREAEVMDPQQRLFLECAFKALEQAGCDSLRYKGAIGVFAGAGMNSYLMNVMANTKALSSVGGVLAGIGNDKDHLTTRVAYKLGLRGPAVTVQTACSTSLVAVHLACQSLLNAECDMALAGGVSIILPQKAGYFYQPGGIFSPDGHCRPFDANGQGTVFSNGAGVVVLKRLEDALVEGDNILAVIKGSAINNDGSFKNGYTAPSIEGQAAVIAEAQAVAGVAAESIGYVEAHGTGTPLGDPVEFAALLLAFDARCNKKQFCALGSTKANIGHLDTAAGVTGLIKSVLMLRHKLIPPLINFSSVNPEIDLDNSPFYINTETRKWFSPGVPRRAAVSSFGIGGTNAHVILEEAPHQEPTDEGRLSKLLLWSGRTPSSLETLTNDLASHLRNNPGLNLDDLAYTLQVGRRAYSNRRMLVVSDMEEAQRGLSAAPSDPGAPRYITRSIQASTPKAVFLFPGQGSQYVGMGRSLYGREDVFTRLVDDCAELLERTIGRDIREALYCCSLDDPKAREQLKQTQLAQATLFTIEYALARQLMHWGIVPFAMIGHSIGELVAAALAEVVDLPEAVRMVAVRASLMAKAPSGAMIAVGTTIDKLGVHLGEQLDVAAFNGPKQIVVSGQTDLIEELENKLTRLRIPSRRIETSHAFHSRMMDQAAAEFGRSAAEVAMKTPRMKYISNVTGAWAGQEVRESRYWAEQMRKPVRLTEGLREVGRAAGDGAAMLQVGPGESLIRLAGEQLVGIDTIATLGRNSLNEETMITRAIGEMWLRGVELDWDNYKRKDEKRRKIEVPGHPFERESYWISMNGPEVKKDTRTVRRATTTRDVRDMLYVPVWKQSPKEYAQDRHKGVTREIAERCLVLSDEGRLGAAVAARLRGFGEDVEELAVSEDGRTEIEQSLNRAEQQGRSIGSVIDLREVGRTRRESLTGSSNGSPVREKAAPEDGTELKGFYRQLSLCQALGNLGGKNRVRLAIVTSNLQDVTGEETIDPLKASAIAFCKVIGKEHPAITCCTIDVVVPETPHDKERLAAQLTSELFNAGGDSIIAFRGNHRWIQSLDSLKLAPAKGRPNRLREGGVYLITGGLGAIGLTLAEYLAQAVPCNLVLIGRSAFPAKALWDNWLAENDPENAVSKKIRRLQALATLGTEIYIARADVADEEQVQGAVAQARLRFGEINGVVHAAGIPGRGIIQLKTRTVAERVLAPKVRGTLILARALKDANLDFFLLCSSAISISGAAGQIDYCAANAFLDAYARGNNSEREPLIVSVNWDAWREDGMAAGRAISDGRYVAPSTAQVEKIETALFERRIIESPDRQVYISELAPATHWILGEHRIMGTAVVPATAYLEMARSAFHIQGYGEALDMRDVLFLSPIVIQQNETREIITILEREGEEVSFRVLTTEMAGPGEAAMREHVRGRLKALHAAPVSRLEIDEILRRCQERRVVNADAGELDRRTTGLFLGPRWNSVKEVYLGVNEMLALLELPEKFSDELKHFGLHPSLLDAATGVMVRSRVDGFYLPITYEKVRVLGPLSKTIYSHITEKQANGLTLRFDVVISDQEGSKRVEVEGLILKRTVREPPSVLLTGLEKRASDRISHGLSNREGVEAFARILSGARSPQVVVTARDRDLTFENDEPLAPVGSEQADAHDSFRGLHSRPSLQTPYVAPEGDVQQRIVDIWRELLGIEQIGVNDNFFDLGGHSLMALQFMSRLSESFGLTLPVNDVFEMPTVAELAKAVEKTVMEKIRAKVDRLSEEEARLILQQDVEPLLEGLSNEERR
jgi:phthiocerol/phenolphthiocerol synthesis type-I polyketide synthase E